MGEIYSGVASSQGWRLKELVPELAAMNGVTVALIEQDMAFVRDLADAVVVLRGKVPRMRSEHSRTLFHGASHKMAWPQANQ